MRRQSQYAFVRHPYDRVERLDPDRFEGFCRGEHALRDVTVGSLDAPPYRDSLHADLLLITLRYDHGSRTPRPDLIEPLRIRLDEHGYLCHLHLEPVRPVKAPAVADLRPRLIRRYLQRTWQWSPSTEVIDAALAECEALQRQVQRYERH
jgi:hypothetical protein